MAKPVRSSKTCKGARRRPWARASAEFWTFYVLECGDHSLYAGITNDLDRRIGQHKAGTGARYTRAKGVAGLRCAIVLPDQGLALRLEASFRRLSRTRKLAFIASVIGHGFAPVCYDPGMTTMTASTEASS